MALFSRKPRTAPQPVSVPAGGPSATAAAAGGIAGSEARLIEIGTQLLTAARGHKAGLLSAAFYSDALMNWSMKDPNFKVQLFRFVDCFPTLRTPEQVFEVLDDYLSQPGVTVPGPIAAALKLGNVAKGLAAGQISK